ncbi:MAG: hypothetical protein AAF600_19515 [Bacteroidota bacterium]
MINAINLSKRYITNTFFINLNIKVKEEEIYYQLGPTDEGEMTSTGLFLGQIHPMFVGLILVNEI